MKFARIPVALHGRHSHKFNYPMLTSCNFMQVLPVFYRFLYKGENSRVTAPVFTRLNPIVNPAFATGRINFKAFFVPAKYVYRPWYYLDSGVEYHPLTGGLPFVPDSAPYTTLEMLGKAFCDTTILSPYVTEVGATDPTDIIYHTGDPVPKHYVVTPLGAKLLTTLQNLGITPVFADPALGGTTRVNIMNILSYIRIYLDYYFPSQYVNSSDYTQLLNCIALDNNAYNDIGSASLLLFALAACSIGVYDQSLFDAGFDNPVAPSVDVNTPDVQIKDNTNDSNKPMLVDTIPDAGANLSPAASYNSRPSNGTPGIYGSDAASSARSAYGVITQYVLDSLKSLNNFVKRHQLAGGRLIDNVLARRGQKLNHDSILKPYFLGSDDVEINIDAVFNTTDDNLGEMAGRGVAGTDPKAPLQFSCSAEDDGIFMIVAFVRPDYDLPVSTDIANLYVDQFDLYHPEFDKLGVEAVPSLSIQHHFNGEHQFVGRDTPFCFLPRYAGYLQEHSRLSGDFRLVSRGSQSLSAFYTFRQLTNPIPIHGLEFVTGQDNVQYQRLFYSSDCDNFHMYIRFHEQCGLYKLPLGDSFDWNDDELNQKVNVAITGSQTA